MKLIKEKAYDIKITIALTIIPILGIFGTLLYVINNGVVWQEPLLLIVFWIITGLSITIGYHRLFCHRSFTAHPILEWLLAFSGAAALENSILKWCSDHRQHHKYLDTDQDPYSITKGFFHAHIGWILENNPSPIINVNDLQSKTAIRFQCKYYFPLFVVFGIALPIALGFLWGRPLGALFWGVFLRITLVHHFTYSINSLSHYIGKKPYNHKCTSRDSWYLAFLTFGEGFHNYHHKFQWDYRNGIRWFHYDPSKWTIWLFSKIGLAKELKKADQFWIIKTKALDTWNQVNDTLNSIPNQIRKSYQLKLNDIIIKLNNLEESHRIVKSEVISFYDDKKEMLLLQKLFRKKTKLYKIEYQAIMNTLSVMLFAIQTRQFYEIIP